MLVHSGDNHGGHYVVYLNPKGDGKVSVKEPIVRTFYFSPSNQANKCDRSWSLVTSVNDWISWLINWRILCVKAGLTYGSKHYQSIHKCGQSFQLCRMQVATVSLTYEGLSAIKILLLFLSGASLMTTWCRGAPRRRPSSTTTAGTTTTCRCATARTPTCWSTSASPSSVSRTCADFLFSFLKVFKKLNN